MASLTSPDWRGFLRRAPLPAAAVHPDPVAPTAGRVLRPPTPQAEPARRAAPSASRAAAWPPAPSAAFPDWWPAAWPPQPTPPPHPSRQDAGATSPRASRQDAGATSQPPPPTRPAPAQAQPVPPRGPRPLSPRLRLALEWVVSALPEQQREAVFSDVLETLRFRAALEERSSLESGQPIGRERFGLAGEALAPEGTVRVRLRLEDEVRETLRTLEARLSRTRSNHYLAMHSARLGQLWRELETRFDIDVLEEVKSALGRCWA